MPDNGPHEKERAGKLMARMAPRAEELTIRTNQLNTTGRTFSHVELEQLLHSRHHLLLVAELKDRYESRFHRTVESEANLLGVVFDPAGIMTGAPYRVVDGSHWAFAGTGLHNGDVFGERCLHMRCPGGASGHETDKISPSSPAGIQLLAWGQNPDEGGAHLTYFETGSGGVAIRGIVICGAALGWATSPVPGSKYRIG